MNKRVFCRIFQELQRDECMYAISQGAMAVECRLDDQDTLDLISKLHHTETLTCCVAERAFLRQLVRTTCCSLTV